MFDPTKLKDHDYPQSKSDITTTTTGYAEGIVSAQIVTPGDICQLMRGLPADANITHIAIEQVEGTHTTRIKVEYVNIDVYHPNEAPAGPVPRSAPLGNVGLQLGMTTPAPIECGGSQ